MKVMLKLKQAGTDWLKSGARWLMVDAAGEKTKEQFLQRCN